MTARPLTLRFPEPADADALHEAVRESIEGLHRWMAWCAMDYSLDDAARWIAAQPAAREAGTAFEFVVLGDRGRFLGCCGLNEIDRGCRMANLGYWVRSSETGRGIATRAARWVADWAFLNTDLQRLEILVATGNEPSLAVARKAGALCEGVLRSRFLVHGRFLDVVAHSIVRPDEHGNA